jgi:large subunit ribosomal protein L4
MEKEIKEKTTKKTEVKTEVKLDSSVWEVPFNGDLIAQVLYVYGNNERKGTSNAKTRGDVSGGGRKPWKQKGTGRARQGSIRSPLWVGGGVTFVPNNKNWKRYINKQMARKATCIMLSERLRDEELNFVEIPKTDIRKALLKQVKKNLLVVSGNEEVRKSLQNVENIKIVNPIRLNAKHLAGSKNVLMDKEGIKILEERLTNGK